MDQHGSFDAAILIQAVRERCGRGSGRGSDWPSHASRDLESLDLDGAMSSMSQAAIADTAGSNAYFPGGLMGTPRI